ncbi:MAG: hypothetical protein Q8O00_05990 [Holophaga sp.]|nr:hypothetical protein [Holophaga sp.]
MTEGHWDSEAPAAKKGLPTWAKIVLGCCGGCALIFVVIMASCVGLIRSISKNGVPAVIDKAVGSAFLDKAWMEMANTVKSLSTAQGTKDLYRTNPGLSETFATEEDFLAAAEEWRPRLGEFPAQRPQLGDLIRDQKSGGRFQINTNNSRTRIDYQIPKGGMLYLELESGKLVDVRVE